MTDSNFANQYVFYVDALIRRPHAASSPNMSRRRLQARCPQGAKRTRAGYGKQFRCTLSSRVDLSAPRDGDLAEGMKVFTSATPSRAT